MSSEPLPVAGDASIPVPVYDCHVILSRPDEEGVMHARVSTLPGITASGRTEREILRRIVADFKSALIAYRERGEPVPWRQAQRPAEGEMQRWVPVHL